MSLGELGELGISDCVGDLERSSKEVGCLVWGPQHRVGGSEVSKCISLGLTITKLPCDGKGAIKRTEALFDLARNGVDRTKPPKT